MQKMVADAWQRGLYLSANNNVLRLTPPLIITEEEISFALSVLDDVIGAAAREAGISLARTHASRPCSWRPVATATRSWR